MASAKITNDDVWVAEKMAMAVLKKEGAFEKDGWLFWEIPWHEEGGEAGVPTVKEEGEDATEEASQPYKWNSVEEATCTEAALPVPPVRVASQGPRKNPAADAAGYGNGEDPLAKRAKSTKNPGVTKEYWEANGVPTDSAHFQWLYGKPGGPMGWCAYDLRMQGILEKQMHDGIEEFDDEDSDKEQ